MGGGRDLGNNEYMYMYGWVPSWSTWNYHDIVHKLYSSIKCLKKDSTYRIILLLLS